jgi:hypothetical protein
MRLALLFACSFLVSVFGRAVRSKGFKRPSHQKRNPAIKRHHARKTSKPSHSKRRAKGFSNQREHHNRDSNSDNFESSSLSLSETDHSPPSAEENYEPVESLNDNQNINQLKDSTALHQLIVKGSKLVIFLYFAKNKNDMEISCSQIFAFASRFPDLKFYTVNCRFISTNSLCENIIGVSETGKKSRFILKTKNRTIYSDEISNAEDLGRYFEMKNYQEITTESDFDQAMGKINAKNPTKHASLGYLHGNLLSDLDKVFALAYKNSEDSFIDFECNDLTSEKCKTAPLVFLNTQNGSSMVCGTSEVELVFESKDKLLANVTAVGSPVTVNLEICDDPKCKVVGSCLVRA